jgi:radial spoke head protein 4A
MASANELRQLLKEDESGKNLYSHLTETLMKLMLDHPKNAYDMFELVSAEVKANPLSPDPTAGAPLPMSDKELEKRQAWAKACAALLKVPDEPAEESACKFPDLVDEANLLEWAGISLGKSEVYKLFLSVKKFAESLPGEVESLRFFGKIETRGQPYYVVQGLAEAEEGADEKEQEGPNGNNKYAYWVSQSAEVGDWVKLPNVTCEQIVVARQFKRFLTGDLESPISYYPPFPGNKRDPVTGMWVPGVEKNLLRTQIERIAGATSISPDGFFEASEDEPPAPKLAEPEALNEAFPKASGDLKDAEAWKHHYSDCNIYGRTLPLLNEEGEPVEMEPPQESPEILSSAVPEAWSIRVSPDGAGASAGSMVYAQSLVWPGATAVYAGRRFVNVYVGNAVPYGPCAFPAVPAAFQNEWVPPEGEETAALAEEADVRVDPTPPVPEGEEE